MKEVLMSTKHRHILDIHSGTKTNELRTKPPKIECPFKVYNYDIESSGGCGKVVSEWICDSMETWRICMGVPQHLITTGCVSSHEILKYTNNGYKDLTAMHISNLVIYDTPKELSEFRQCHKCEYYSNCKDGEYSCDGTYRLTRPPQNWCYVVL